MVANVRSARSLSERPWSRKVRSVCSQASLLVQKKASGICRAELAPRLWATSSHRRFSRASSALQERGPCRRRDLGRERSAAGLLSERPWSRKDVAAPSNRHGGPWVCAPRIRRQACSYKRRHAFVERSLLRGFGPPRPIDASAEQARLYKSTGVVAGLTLVAKPRRALCHRRGGPCARPWAVVGQPHGLPLQECGTRVVGRPEGLPWKSGATKRAPGGALSGSALLRWISGCDAGR